MSRKLFVLCELGEPSFAKIRTFKVRGAVAQESTALAHSIIPTSFYVELKETDPGYWEPVEKETR